MTTSIKHRVIIETTAEQLFTALSTGNGVASWWAPTKATDNLSKGDQLDILFGPNGEHVVGMQVIESNPSQSVVWKCVSGPWENTDCFSFDIEADPLGVALTFENSGWQAQDDFYAHCNAKWGFFLAVSLKNLLEIGSGQAHPMDPNI